MADTGSDVGQVQLLLPLDEPALARVLAVVQDASGDLLLFDFGFIVLLLLRLGLFFFLLLLRFFDLFWFLSLLLPLVLLIGVEPFTITTFGKVSIDCLDVGSFLWRIEDFWLLIRLLHGLNRLLLLRLLILHLFLRSSLEWLNLLFFFFVRRHRHKGSHDVRFVLDLLFNRLILLLDDFVG